MLIRDKSELDEGIKTKDGKRPNPNTIHPIAGYDKEIYVKPTITNPNIIAGALPISPTQISKAMFRICTSGMTTSSSSENSAKSPPALSL